jgi:adenylate cyclase
MRRATKRRVQLFLRLLLVGTLIGVAYGGLIGLTFRGTALINSLIGAIDGATITAAIAAVEIFLLRTRWGRPLQQAPFLVTFGVKWLIYGVVIMVVNARSLGQRVLGLALGAAPLDESLELLGVFFSFVAAFVVLLGFEIGQIVGPRNLRNIVLGRYHRPRSEERFFLFVDIEGSTSLAERIGPIAVRFLDGVFRLASDPIGDHGGEIYQYVGDEMVVTWTAAEARGDARPIACFFAIVAALEDVAPAFEREFGVAPRLRAALHAGPVISGEIGDSKRDIVFHGDVMNTAARLEQATRDLDRRFLISTDALRRLAGPPSDTPLSPSDPRRFAAGRRRSTSTLWVPRDRCLARASGTRTRVWSRSRVRLHSPWWQATSGHGATELRRLLNRRSRVLRSDRAALGQHTPHRKRSQDPDASSAQALAGSHRRVSLRTGLEARWA